MSIVVRDRRGGHWAWFHHAIIDDYGPLIGPYGIAVYACLCRHAGGEETTFVGQGTIARAIGAGRTSVNLAVAKLRELGLIEVESRVDEYGRTTNTYTLLDPPDVRHTNRGDAPEIPSGEQPAVRHANSLPSRNKNHGGTRAPPGDRFERSRYARLYARDDVPE